MFIDIATKRLVLGYKYQGQTCLMVGILLFFMSTSRVFGIDLQAPSAVIFGDSIAVGAATHPSLEFDGGVIWEALNGKVDVAAQSSHVPALSGLTLEKPLVTLPTRTEVIETPIETASNIISQSLMSLFLNTEEYSHGYQVAKRLGVSGSNIVVSAFGGARMRDFSIQVQRFLETTQGQLTKYVFITFTGNDLCSTPSFSITEPEDFEHQLVHGLERLKAAIPHPDGTVIVMTNMLPITKLAQDASILNKSVKAYGSMKTCRELRETGFLPPKEYVHQSAVAKVLPPQLFPPNPSFMCPNLFAPEKSMKENLTEIATTSGIYREVMERVSKTFQSDSKNIKLLFVKEAAAMDLKPEDIAVDCFHLSATGQSKLSDMIMARFTK